MKKLKKGLATSALLLGLSTLSFNSVSATPFQGTSPAFSNVKQCDSKGTVEIGRLSDMSPEVKDLMEKSKKMIPLTTLIIK